MTEAGATGGEFAFEIVDTAGDAGFGNFHSDLNVHSLIDPVTVKVDHHGSSINIMLSPDMMEMGGSTPNGSLMVIAIDENGTVVSDPLTSLSLIHISEPTRLLSIAYSGLWV